ncbi:phenylalanine--tRNA ligase subunit alpha [Candidatus Micrarchaeota archaeon]|nr:phenylalanine--tRNA ligase subunit alpha [Candidatus Micrarchaeota archaeon]
MSEYKGEQELINYLHKKWIKNPIDGVDAKTAAQDLNLNEDTIRRASQSLKEKGCIEIDEGMVEEFAPTDEFKQIGKESYLPEVRIYLNSKQKGEKGLEVRELSNEERAIGIKWAKNKGLIEVENGVIKAKNLNDPHLIRKINDKLILFYEKYSTSNMHPLRIEFLVSNSDDQKFFDEAVLRKWLVKKVIRIQHIYFKKFPVVSEEKFSIAPVAEAELGKNHPLTILSKRIKRIFAELGFEEMDGSIIESSFWNFDALFQPQDHPARELADTFYLKGTSNLPDSNLVKKVKNAHEKGWKYKWKEEDAKKLLLRTHTTALSARYLSDLKSTPKKYFAVGRVFRNEATDYKHLAEFHQVEGVVAWENATFRDLLGILKEFYAKLGFDKIRFRPSFFPYTEPSLEVEVYFEPRKQWMELGGAGIARPEVSIPLSGVYPVLLWGLSLERPLMLSMGLEDIRTFYKNDLEWLKSARV